MKRTAPTLFLILLLASPGVGQELLTLDRAVSIARGQNHSLLASRHERTAAGWARRSAITGWFPSIELTAGITRIDPQTVAQANAAIDFIRSSAPMLGIPPSLLADMKPFAYRDTYSAGIIAVQPVYNGGLELIGIQAANAMLEKSEFALRGTEQDVDADVRIAYYAVLKARALRDLAAESVERTKQWLAQTERRAEQGQRTKTDVLRFKVQLARDEGALVSAQNGLVLASLRLNECMGVPLDTEYRLEETISLDSALAMEPGTVVTFSHASLRETTSAQHASESFLETHPFMREMESNIRLTDLAVARAKSGFQPRINLAFQYGWEKNNTIALDGIRPWALALTVQWPIFSGFRDYTNVRKAEAEYQRTLEQSENLRRGLLIRARSAELALTASQKQIAISRTGLLQATEVMQAIARKYDLGSASNVDLIDAQTAYFTAKTGFTAAVYDHAIARIQLDHATGMSR